MSNEERVPSLKGMAILCTILITMKIVESILDNTDIDYTGKKCTIKYNHKKD